MDGFGQHEISTLWQNGKSGKKRNRRIGALMDEEIYQ